MMEFDIKGYADTPLTPVIYIIQGLLCIFVFLPFCFILRCWQRFLWTRNIRTGFTMYLSGMDSVSRLIFLIYYLIRLITIYRNGLWMVEDDDGNQNVISRFCKNSNLNSNSNSTVNPDCVVENLISRRDCLTFSLFLYWASTWPMSSILLLQIHALVASLIPAYYARVSNFKFCISTMLITLCLDLIMGIFAYGEISSTLFYTGQSDIFDGCKFEYFSRLSLISSWYVFGLLLCIGILTLVQLMVSYVNRRKRRGKVNPVANSPVLGWCRMTNKERRLTLIILTCSIVSFILFLIHFIVYLVEGNSALREIFSITISIFAFFGPVEMMWFNIDLKKAVFITFLGDGNEDGETSKEIEQNQNSNLEMR